MLWIKIGFLPINLTDVLDILIVGYLIYLLYKLLRGSIAFNIFIGLLILYALYGLVGLLEMNLLYTVLNQVLGVGVIMLLIVFQPEVRRFLLMLGNNTLRQRSRFFKRLLDRNLTASQADSTKVNAIVRAMETLKSKKTGALILFTPTPELTFARDAGVLLDAEVSKPLLENIFQKDAPLHDGAIVISQGKIVAASVVLPVNTGLNLPASLGLRHRAAVSSTEGTPVQAFIISEETGEISYAKNGLLERKVKDRARLRELVEKCLT